MIFSLRFGEAQTKITELKIAEPDNQIRHLLANYIDCLTIFVSDDEDAFDQLKQNKRNDTTIDMPGGNIGRCHCFQIKQ